MIKANELRIGNWLLDDGEPTYIHSISSGGISFFVINDVRINKQTGCGIEGGCERFKPIALTHEWLLKFGFEQKGSCYIKVGFNTLADYGSQCISLYLGGAQLEFGYYENQLDCSYVHSLQNLYFVIMGEELTIKETA